MNRYKLPKIKVAGTLGWIEFDGDREWAFSTVEGVVWQMEYEGQELDLAGNIGKRFVLHGTYFDGTLFASKLEAL